MNGKAWGASEWYLALNEKRNLKFCGDWVLYQEDDSTVQLINTSGATCVATVDDDSYCRVRGSEEILPLPDDVIEELRTILYLV